jgi:hypothetical protein
MKNPCSVRLGCSSCASPHVSHSNTRASHLRLRGVKHRSRDRAKWGKEDYCPPLASLKKSAASQTLTNVYPRRGGTVQLRGDLR